MENKQTAVEWLVKMLHSPVCVGFIQGRKQIPHHIIEQAKQMEKEQITKAYNSAIPFKFGEQYYNEKYANDTTKGLPEEDSKRRAWHY